MDGRLAKDAAKEQKGRHLDHVDTQVPPNPRGVLQFLDFNEALWTHLIHFDDMVSHAKASARRTELVSRSVMTSSLGSETLNLQRPTSTQST